jgi:hypothetical protein
MSSSKKILQVVFTYSCASQFGVILTSGLGRLLAREVDSSHWRVKAGPSCPVTNPPSLNCPERTFLRELNPR